MSHDTCHMSKEIFERRKKFRYTLICQLFDEDQFKEVLEKMVLETLKLSADLPLLGVSD